MTDQLFSLTAVDYEVALGALGNIIAYHAEVIGIEYGKAVPDEAVIAAAQEAQDELDTIREKLDPRDSDAIERVIAQYGPQSRALYQ